MRGNGTSVTCLYNTRSRWTGKNLFVRRGHFQAEHTARRTTAQAPMTSQVIVVREVSPQPDPGLGWHLVVSQIDVLVLHRPPQPLDHNVVERTPDAVHADRDLRTAQHASKRLGGELAALVGVEYLRRSAQRQRLTQRRDTKFASIVLLNSQAKTQRVNQSITATR